MEDRESKLAAPVAMDEDREKKEQERLITRKRKKKGIPRKLVLCNENFSISESSRQNPTDFFTNEEGFDLNRIERGFHPCSLIIRTGEEIIAKLTSVCESCFCNCYIVSATGCVSRASVFQCGVASTYEGWYEIVSLSGHVSRSLNPSHGSGYRVVITLADKNDSLFGGYVSGPLIAATNVQIVLWKFTIPSEGEAASVRDSSSTVESPVTKMEVP